MKKNLTFSLPADDYEALRKHCAALGVSVSGFIRALLRDAVPELRRKYSEIERGAARKRRLAA